MQYKNIFRMLCLSFSLFLVACASENENYYRDTVQSWVNAKEEKLFAAWGYPDRIEKLSNGNRKFIYRSDDRNQAPTTNNVSNAAVPSTSNKESCVVWFEVNDQHVIISTHYQGDNCVATESYYQMHANH